MRGAIDTVKGAFELRGALRAEDLYLPQLLPPADQLRFAAGSNTPATPARHEGEAAAPGASLLSEWIVARKWRI